MGSKADALENREGMQAELLLGAPEMGRLAEAAQRSRSMEPHTGANVAMIAEAAQSSSLSA